MYDLWLNATIRDVLIALAGITLVITIGIIIVRWIINSVHPIMLKFTDIYELIMGKPKKQGIPAQPSMMDRFDSQDQANKEIKTELSGLKDELTQVKQEVTKLNTKFDEHTKEENSNGRTRA